MSGAAESLSMKIEDVGELEYGKYCSTPGGSIEPKAEYQVLGYSDNFPREMVPLCRPSRYGLSKNIVEVDTFGLLDSRQWGTVIWPVRQNSQLFYLAYRMGQRHEGGPRKYFVARYLCANSPINPWSYYQAMTELKGLTRKEAGRLKGIQLASADAIGADECDPTLADRALNGMREYRRSVYAVIDDEKQFFRLCGTIWSRLTPAQQALFSCGWNVGPSFGQRLFISFGPAISDRAAKLDPSKAFHPGRPTARKTRPRKAMLGDVQQALIMCANLGEKKAPDPYRGFMDPLFVAVFCGERIEDAIIEWMPEILLSADLQEEDRRQLVRTLLSFDVSLQSTLYTLLGKTILQQAGALRLFATLVRACRDFNQSWGKVNAAAVVHLAMALQEAKDKGTVQDRLASMGPADLALSERLPAFYEVLYRAFAELPADRIAGISRKLLAGPLPSWFRRWAEANLPELIALLFARQDAETFGLLASHFASSPVVAVGQRFLSGPPGPDAELAVGRLDQGAKAKLAGSAYQRWLEGDASFAPWLMLFAEDLPPSLVAHQLAAWRAEPDRIVKDARREFELRSQQRQRLLQHLSHLCDEGTVLFRPELSDRIWTAYVSVGGEVVGTFIRNWQTPAGRRQQLIMAAHEGDVDQTLDAILDSSGPLSFESLSPDQKHLVTAVLDALIADPVRMAANERLILEWPQSEGLRAWLQTKALYMAALLLAREGTNQTVRDRFGSICPMPIWALWDAILHFKPITEEIESIRRQPDFDRAVEAGFAKHIARNWGGTQEEGWESVVLWARWSRSNDYADIPLRLLAGLSFDARRFLSQPDWIALREATTNEHFCADATLCLARSVLRNAFEAKRPSPDDFDQAVRTIRRDGYFDRQEKSWIRLWAAAKAPWQRLFVLATARKCNFAISASGLDGLRTELEMLERTIKWRVSDPQSKAATPSADDGYSAITQKLEVVAARFQQLSYGDPNWRDEFATTNLMGAFRGTPLQLYQGERLQSVLNAYFSELSKNESAPKMLEEFARSYKHNDSDFRRVLDMIDRSFLQRHVWPHEEDRKAILESLKVKRERSTKKIQRMIGITRSVDWENVLKGYSVREDKRIIVDTDLQTLIGWVAEHDSEEQGVIR